MFLHYGTINIWPTRAEVDRSMPEDFKNKFPTTRVIIDCTEVICQMPSNLLLNSELFSNYKNHTTLKGLVLISLLEQLARYIYRKHFRQGSS